LGSNIFDFSIWALFIVIGTKETLKKQKKKEKKSPKKPNFKKVVSEQLPISLTANRPVNR
jgi:hypothetical protein